MIVGHLKASSTREGHRFFLEGVELKDIKAWCLECCTGKWLAHPEIRVDPHGPVTSSTIMTSVTIYEDRDAALFKLTW